MANEQNELNCVNWGQVFGFTRIFKSFRLAMNMSALALGLAAIVLVWVTGSLLSDAFGLTGQTVPARITFVPISDPAGTSRILC